MKKFGGLIASAFVAAVGVAGAQQFPDPTIMVNTPSGMQVPVTLPPATFSAQTYQATSQPVVVPVPINLEVTPNVISQRVPYTVPVPTPVVIQQQPVQVPAPAPMPMPRAPIIPAQTQLPCPTGSCIPIDGRSPLPFDIPTDMPRGGGPITSSVLVPPGYDALQFQQQPVPAQPFQPQPQFQQQFQQQTNPLFGQQAGQQFGLQSAPYQAPAPVQPFPQQQFQTQGVSLQQLGWGPSYPAQQVPPMQVSEPLTVPAPGVPYSLDAQGRPHYVTQPQSVLPTPQQWPGYTPVPQPTQQQIQQQMMIQQQQAQQFGMVPQAGFGLQQRDMSPLQADLMQTAAMMVPPDLNPTINPNLTNPNTPVQLVTPDQVRQALAANAPMLVLDVRGELVRDVIGSIPGDISVPFAPSTSFPARARQAIPRTDLPIVVYCNDGISSSQAANMLANMGYRVFLMGIFTGWHTFMDPTASCAACL